MYMTLQEFSQAISSLSLLCNRQDPPDSVRNFWFNQCKYIEVSSLKKAFAYFGTQAKWPSLAELLDECGIKPPPNRRQREAAEEKSQQSQESTEPDRRAETEYGFWCFRSECETQKELQKKTEGLKSLGWTVWKTRDLTIKREEKIGTHTRSKQMFARDHFAFRGVDLTPDEIESTKKRLCDVFGP